MNIFTLCIVVSLVSEIEPDFDRRVMKELQTRFTMADRDRDEKLNVSELISWSKYVDQIIHEEVTHQEWTYYANREEEASQCLWNNYLTDVCNENQECEARVRRRIQIVDANKDGVMSKTELGDLLFPQSSSNGQMLDILLVDLIKTLDKDNDSRISLAEYLSYKKDFSSRSQTHFKNKLDKDHDLRLNLTEIRIWLTEAKDDDGLISTMIRTADVNEDGRLSMEEMLSQYQRFLILLPRSFFEETR